MPRELNDQTDQQDDRGPADDSRPRRPRGRVSGRVAAAAGLSAAVLVGVLVPALAGPSPARADSVTDCVNSAVARISAEAVALPAAQRAAYIRAQVEITRTRCGALATTTTPTTTTTTPTTTTTTPTTTTTTPTTTTTTTTTTTRPLLYTVVATGVVGTGSQTLEASCDPGDQVVTYRFTAATPTGSNRSRSVDQSSDGRTVRVTYEITGTVANQQTGLTVTCRHR